MFIKPGQPPAPGYYEADGRIVTTAGRGTSTIHKRSRHIIQADAGAGAGGFAGGAGFGGIGMGGSNPGGTGFSAGNVDRYNSVRDRLDEDSVVGDWLPTDAAGLDKMFRLMYHRDIAGMIVDLLADTIWSDFDLTGVKDPSILKIYQDTMEALDVVSSGPGITREFLVLGRSVGSLIFDKTRGIFKDIVTHDPDFLRIQPIQIKGFDPKIDLIPSPGLRDFMTSTDPRDMDARKVLPEAFIKAIQTAQGLSSNAGQGSLRQSSQHFAAQAGIPLDPISTMFIARRVFPNDYIGTSLFTRLINFWALEKALLNATLTSARRRIRSILHLQMGIDQVWEPTPSEMDNIAGLFIQADEDPAGAVVGTRTGVTPTELRSGTDFYKWSDEWTLLNEGKMRCLGTNDALLCLSGDTLVPTKERGLVRIDSYGREGSDVALTTIGRMGEDRTKRWLYSGKGEVVEVKTHQGTTLKCTSSHQVLALINNELVWKPVGELNLGDVLCFNKTKCVRETALGLDLVPPVRKRYANSLNENVVAPTCMTPDLAYLVGILVSEGCVSKYRIRVSNTNLSVLDGVRDKLLKVFGPTISVKIKKCNSVGKPDRVDKHGVVWRTIKDSYELCVWSMYVASYFEQLGLCTAPGRQSRNKVIPWSILEADEKSQLSYMAAYIDGDGSVGKKGKHVVFYSFSQNILSQTQALLASHGIDSRVRAVSLSMTRGNAFALSQAISEYSLSGKFDQLASDPSEGQTKGNFPDREYGIKTDGIRKILNDRFVKKVVNVGATFQDDEGKEVTIQRFGNITIERWNHLVYRSYEAGEYDEFLSALSKISAREYEKVMYLFSRRFKYTKVTSVQKLEEKLHVYDIQMESDPSFVANCLVVHNSGDATYSNQESANMFFMERASNLRDLLTQRMFHKKLFPLIARIHGFQKRSQAELTNKIRVNRKDAGGGEIEEPVDSLTQREALAIPDSQLITPGITWRKELLYKIDEKRLDLYDRMEDKVPVTIKMWASAANIDLDALVSDLDGDADLRRKIGNWRSSFDDILDVAEEGARLEFINQLKGLNNSRAKASLDSDEVSVLGPITEYLFWGPSLTIGGVTIKEMSKFLAKAKERPTMLFDPTVLQARLHQHFQHSLKAEVAGFILYRCGISPVKPSLSTDAIVEVSDHVKRTLDAYSSHGNVYQLAGVANKELRALAGLHQGKASDKGVSNMEKAASVAAKRPSSLRTNGKKDPLGNGSTQLYSGVAKFSERDNVK